MLKRPVGAVVALWLSVCAFAAEGQGVRIAVLDKDGSSSAEALLTATLSKQNGVAVLERTELQKIIEEKKLQTLMVSGEFRALGELTGADGILLLETLTLKGGEKFRSARLIATNSGACLFAEKIPDADGQLEAWGALLAARVGGRAAALRSRTSPSAAVAVLNLRSVSGSAQDRELERTATRLLEFGLGRQEKFLLLERRSLAEVLFEKSLDATDALPLLNSQVLVDGSFEPDGADTLTLKLRLRRAAVGDATTLTVSAIPADAKSIAEAALQKLLADFHLPAASVTVSGEADEFMREALWAWRALSWETCREALNTAEALGCRTPDLYAMRYATVRYILEQRQLEREFIKKEKLNLIREALRDALRYKASGVWRAEYFRGNLSPHLSFDQRNFTYSCQYFISGELSSYDSEGAEKVGDIREMLREFSDVGGENFLMVAGGFHTYALDWRELIDFYDHTLNREKTGAQYWPQALTSGKPLGRFASDAAARKAWNNLLARHEKNPRHKAWVLLIRAAESHGDGQKEQYEQYVRYVIENGKDLLEHGELPGLLYYDRYYDGYNALELAGLRAHLLISLFETMPREIPQGNHFADGFQIPPEFKSRANRAFARYYQVCMTVENFYLSTGKPKDKEDTKRDLSYIANRLELNLPAAQAELSMPTLTVTQYWQPYGLPGDIPDNFVLSGAVVKNNAVWLQNYKNKRDEIWQVSLPALSVSVHEINKDSRSLAVGERFFYLSRQIWHDRDADGHDLGSDYFLARYDFAKNSLEEFSAPDGGRPLLFKDRVFLQSGDALWEWHPAQNNFSLFYSSRRKPDEASSDNHGQLSYPVIISGYQGEPWAVFQIARDTKVLRRLGGDWKIIKELPHPFPVVYADTAIIISPDHGVLLVDEKNPQPRWLLKTKRNDDTEPAAHGWIYPETNNHFHDFAYHDGELFGMVCDDTGQHYLRRWRKGGPPEGTPIKLLFTMSGQQAELTKRHATHNVFWMTPRNALEPNTAANDCLRLYAADSGLVLIPSAHGFWFIPYEDLEKIK